MHFIVVVVSFVAVFVSAFSCQTFLCLSFKFILVIMHFVVVSFVAIFVSAFPCQTFLCLSENNF